MLGLMLSAGPALAELTFYRATTCAIILSNNPVEAGQPLTLTGRVQDGRHAPVAGGRVQIEMAETPQGPWQVLAAGRPDPEGNFHIVDHSLGLESRTFFLRAVFSGHDDGRVYYRASLSPAVPLVVKNRDRAEENLSMGFIEAAGDASSGPAAGSWEYVIRAKALKEVRRAVFQGYAGDWVPLAGPVLDFRADAGQVMAREPEDDADDTLITWRLERLRAGEEATLRVMVGGAGSEESAEGDAALPIRGEGDDVSED